MPGLARRLGRALPDYARHAWAGLVAPRLAAEGPARVVQGVVLSDCGVLLTVRPDLRGWELPGGHMMPGETPETALAREIREETGVVVEVGALVGEYERTGFWPHRAQVYRCRVTGGTPRPTPEAPVVRWCDPNDPPDTLFPWFREPLADALAQRAEPVRRRRHQGLGAIWAGLRIDVRMRLSGDRAGGRERG